MVNSIRINVFSLHITAENTFRENKIFEYVVICYFFVIHRKYYFLPNPRNSPWQSKFYNFTRSLDKLRIFEVLSYFQYEIKKISTKLMINACKILTLVGLHVCSQVAGQGEFLLTKFASVRFVPCRKKKNEKFLKKSPSCSVVYILVFCPDTIVYNPPVVYLGSSVARIFQRRGEYRFYRFVWVVFFSQ